MKRDVKAQIAASFKELVLEMPVEKMTIKDITDRAGVIRVTFYNHFQDKYEVLEYIVQSEVLEPIKILIRNNLIKEAVVVIFSNMLKDREFYERVIHLEGQNSFDSIIRKCIYEELLEFIVEKSGDRKTKYSWITNEYLADYYTQSMAFIVLGWIKTGMIVPPEEMGEIYNYIAYSSMADVIEDMN